MNLTNVQRINAALLSNAHELIALAGAPAREGKQFDTALKDAKRVIREARMGRVLWQYEPTTADLCAALGHQTLLVWLGE